MKLKKTVKLSLNKVTVSHLGTAHMGGVRGGRDDIQIETAPPFSQYASCLDCTFLVCGTKDYKSCGGSCWQTCGNTCANSPMACAVPDVDAIE